MLWNLIKWLYNISKTAIRQGRVFFVMQMLVIMTTKTLSQIINPNCDISGGDHASLTFLITFLLALADSLIVCLLALGLRRIHLKAVGIFLMVLSLATAIVELYTMWIYHSVFTMSVVGLFLESDIRESSEMMVSIIGNGIFWLTTLIVCLYLAVSYSLYRYRRLIPKWLTMFVVILSMLSTCVQMNSFIKLYRSFNMQRVSDTQLVPDMPFLHTPNVRLLFGIACHRASYRELKIMKSALLNTRVDSCSFKSPLIVLVIGESHNRFHNALYDVNGPETMPCMHHLQQEGNLVAYDDVVSPSNKTSKSFNEMFSTMNACVIKPPKGDDWTNHTLFPAVFKKAGYRVYFMSNQFVLNVKEFWSSLGGGPLTESGFSDLLFDKRNKEVYPYDMQLLDCPEFPSHRQLLDQPSLLIVHLLGEHVEYCNRYPSDYNHFNRNNVKVRFGGSSAKQITADYYNAQTYTDAVLDSLFMRFRNDDAICIYLSDHGEELFDWRDYYNRSHEEPLPVGVARYQYGIPMFMYMTDKFQTNHPDLAERVRAGEHRPFVSRFLPDMLFDLAGIGYKDYDARYDVLSPKYDCRLKRIINDSEDYDAVVGK